MRVLLTGATGFIGRHLLSFWRGRHEVFALVRGENPGVPAAEATCLPVDLTRPLDLGRLPAEVDAILHLAQANVTFPEHAGELFAVNTAAVQQLLDYGRRVGARRFVLASTGDVYGHRLGPCKESDQPRPTSYYGATKLAAELLAQAYSDYLSACSLRLFRPYGPGQTNRLVPRLAAQIRQGKPVALNPGDRPHMNPVYIRDVLVAIDRALGHTFSGALNVAGDTVVSFRELAARIGQVVGAEPRFTETGADAGDSVGDPALMKEVLGRWPMTDLTEGLLRTLPKEGGH